MTARCLADRIAAMGRKVFWVELAPICGLLDRRFRGYCRARDAMSETGEARAPVYLPGPGSRTSWRARNELSRDLPEVDPGRPETSEAWMP